MKDAGPSRILFSSPILAIPPIGGPALRTYGLIRALAHRSLLTVHIQPPWDQTDVQRVSDDLNKLGVKRVIFSETYGSHTAKRYLFRLRRIVSRLFCQNARRQARHLIRLAGEAQISVIWLNFGHVTFPLLKSLRRQGYRGTIVCDTDAVWSRFVLRGVPYLPMSAKPRAWLAGKWKEREERRLSLYADVITAPSHLDADYYREISAGRSRIALTQNVIDVTAYEMPTNQPMSTEPTVVLTGSFNYKNSAVVDAAKWLRNEIWPLVLREVPNARLLLIGPGSIETRLSDPELRIESLGQVDSILPYMAPASVVVVPLRYESGTRFKILEAGALGKCVVSTTLGAEGLPVTHGEHLLIADDAESFAACVCLALVSDPTHFGHNLSRLVRKSFSIQTLEESVGNIVDECSTQARVL